MRTAVEVANQEAHNFAIGRAAALPAVRSRDAEVAKELRDALAMLITDEYGTHNVIERVEKLADQLEGKDK
jgi:hypothetical protein